MGNAWAWWGNRPAVAPAETSSRYVMESASTSHDFVVTSYSLLDGMGAGKSITSRRFNAGGHSWCITFYPDGQKTVDAPHASAFLTLCTEATALKTRYTLSLLRKDGKLLTDRPVAAPTFNLKQGQKSSGWGFDKFVDMSKLQGCDEFTIRCELTVIHDEYTEDVGPIKVPVPPSTTRKQFAKMMKDGTGVDVAVSVGGRLFRAHKNVLAAESPVFMAQLFGEMNANTDADHIQVDDVEPSVFEALLHFVYTDSLPSRLELVCKNDTAELQHLLVAADRYGMDRLKAVCEEKLCRSVDVHTVGFVLALADQHSCVHLKRACMDFITSGSNVVKETEGFKHLKESCPWLISEMLDKKAATLSSGV